MKKGKKKKDGKLDYISPSLKPLILILFLGCIAYIVGQSSKMNWKDSQPNIDRHEKKSDSNTNTDTAIKYNTNSDEFIKTIDISDKSLAFSRVAEIGRRHDIGHAV